VSGFHFCAFSINQSLRSFVHSLFVHSFIRSFVRFSLSPHLLSSAGATAYACGLKTYNGAIGVDPAQKPCGTLLEAAQMKGMKTGVVVTSSITHATPASFLSHAVHREMEDFIATQIATKNVDVLLGGGYKFFANRSDNVNYVTKMQQLG
jgi:alkaline phosphatase